MQLTPSSTGTIVALDVGERRIGVAICDREARLPHPLTTLDNTSSIDDALQTLLSEQQAVVLVIGLPRGLDGQHTAQTAYVERFVATLQKTIGLPCYWQDEALTSRKAEEELIARGKPFTKGDIDSLSATYILEDFLSEHAKETIV